MIQTINNEEHKIPEYFKVKIGKAEMELESDCLISTMCHQVIHKKNSLYNSDDFVMIFDVTKSEIKDFLLSSYINLEEEIDIFGDWMEKFNEYQVEKNKLFCKDLNIEFGDGTKWTVKILDVLYIKNSLEGIDPDIIDLDDSLLHDDVLMIKWIEKNVKWDDISSYAELVKTDEKEAYRTKNFKRAKKEFVAWEKNLSIFDFISLGDMMIEHDEYDDEDED
jgi:hypothetical protein